MRTEEEESAESKPIGKPELLEWANTMCGGKVKCDSMEDLKASLL